MSRLAAWIPLALLAAVLPLAPALAQDAELLTTLGNRVGEVIDLRAEADLKKALYERGLIARSASSLRVDGELLARALGNERLNNELRHIRYRVGDRVFVENGRLNVRGEIVGVNASGSYEVKVWDRVSSISPPNLGNPVDPVTGVSVDGTPDTSVRLADGTERTVADPWNIRENERVMTMEHAEIDRNNGVVDPGAGERAYEVNGYVVDPNNDSTLRERIDKAMADVDRLIESGKLELTLPTDPAARAEKLAELAKLQKEIIIKIFEGNPMGYLRGADANARWKNMHEDAEMRGAGNKIKVGGVLKYSVGVCSDQTAALASVMREVGRRMGFDVRVIHGSTIDGGGHNFMNVRLADGRRYLMDPSWHAQMDGNAPWSALENIDFATFDSRWWSNREIGSWGEKVSAAVEFTEPGSPGRTLLERGVSDKLIATVLVAEAADKVAKGGDKDRVAREVIRRHLGSGADTDSFRTDIANRAESLAASSARSGGLGGALGSMNRDRVRTRSRGRGVRR